MSLNWKFWCKWRWSEIFYVDDDGDDDDDDESFMMIWFLKGFKRERERERERVYEYSVWDIKLDDI